MNIYVGNLPYNCSDDDLGALFEQYGAVSSAKVILDRETQRSRGFGFVEMANDDEGREAIGQLDGFDMSGRTLTVNEARPRQSSGGGGGRGGYGGGHGGGGGGGYRRGGDRW